MTEDRLKEILKKHSEWLMTRFTNDPKGERADLRGADLYGADPVSYTHLCNFHCTGNPQGRRTFSGRN